MYNNFLLLIYKLNQFACNSLLLGSHRSIAPYSSHRTYAPRSRGCTELPWRDLDRLKPRKSLASSKTSFIKSNLRDLCHIHLRYLYHIQQTKFNSYTLYIYIFYSRPFYVHSTFMF